MDISYLGYGYTDTITAEFHLEPCATPMDFSIEVKDKNNPQLDFTQALPTGKELDFPIEGLAYGPLGVYAKVTISGSVSALDLDLKLDLCISVRQPPPPSLCAAADAWRGCADQRVRLLAENPRQPLPGPGAQ